MDEETQQKLERFTDPDEFREWLRARDPDLGTFNGNSIYDCPIAQWSFEIFDRYYSTDFMQSFELHDTWVGIYYEEAAAYPNMNSQEAERLLDAILVSYKEV
jgi:hypothetical protein